MSAEVQLSEYLVLHPVLPVGWCAVIAIATVCAVGVSMWRWPPALAAGRRWLILILRLLVAAAVAVLLFRAEVRWTGRREVQPEVAILLDASRSMAVRDAVLGDRPVARIEAFRRLFLSAASQYRNLCDRALVNPYAFGAWVRPVGNFAPESTDTWTDIAGALRFLATKGTAEPDKLTGQARAACPKSASTSEIRSRLAAVVIVSDGRENRPSGSAEAEARNLSAAGVAVHALGVGADASASSACDVVVRDLRCASRVFIGNRPEVRVVVATLGLKGRSVEVVLTVGDKEVERRHVVPASGRTVDEVVFRPLLDAAGLVRLAVTAQPHKDELADTNNRAETTVLVEEGGVRVLYLDGRLRPEGKYVARVLGEARELDLERRILVGQRAAAAAPSAADIDRFQVVILGDLPASALPAATVERLAERVRSDGLGLAMLGGQSSFGPGGWASTPLAQVMPVTVRQTDGKTQGPLVFRVTAAGQQHFVFAGMGDGRVPLDTTFLPPLAGATEVGPPVSTAQVLAQSEDGRPLVAVGQSGRGRTAAVTVDTTWQWILGARDDAGPEFHRRFWRQLVLWLARRDGPPKGDLWVRTDRLRYVIVDAAHPPMAVVTAGAPAGDSLRLVLSGPQDRQVEVRPVGHGLWRGEIALSAAGSYTLRAETGPAGRQAGTAFVVYEQDLEGADILADHEHLRRVATAGGGTFRHARDVGRLLEELAATLPPQYEPFRCRLTLAEGRAFLAATLAVMIVEWLLRRRWGLA